MNGISPTRVPKGPIAEAVERKDWPAARLELAKKLAQTVDATDSARDVKGVARELVSVMAACEIDDRIGDADDTPLARILAQADYDLAQVS